MKQHETTISDWTRPLQLPFGCHCQAMMLPKEDHRTVGVPQVGGSRIEEVGMSSFNAELPSLSVCL